MADLEEANQLHEAGSYEAACDRYVAATLSGQLEQGYDPTTRGGAAIGITLLALGAAAAAGDRSRINVFSSLQDGLTDDWVLADYEDDCGREAKVAEWREDGALLCGRSEAVDEHERTLRHFSRADPRSASAWSMELGSDRAASAPAGFFETASRDVDHRELSATEFERRLQYKIDLAKWVAGVN